MKIPHWGLIFATWRANLLWSCSQNKMPLQQREKVGRAGERWNQLMVQQFAQLCTLVSQVWKHRSFQVVVPAWGRRKRTILLLHVWIETIISCNNKSHRSYVPEAGSNQGQPRCYSGPCGALEWSLKWRGCALTRQWRRKPWKEMCQATHWRCVYCLEQRSVCWSGWESLQVSGLLRQHRLSSVTYGLLPLKVMTARPIKAYLCSVFIIFSYRTLEVVLVKLAT